PKGGLGSFKKSGGKVELSPGSYRLRIYALKTIKAGVQPFHLGSLLVYCRGFFAILALLAAAFCAVIFVVGLPVKLFQFLSGNPDAAKGWRLFPIAFAILLAGAASFGISLLIDRRHRRTLGGPEMQKQRDEQPDYLVE